MMASRQNKEARDVPSFGAPLGPPTPSAGREAQRKKKLETKPTDVERTRLIAEQEEGGIEESAKRRRERQNRRTEDPKPSPYTRVGETTGKPPTQILAERPEDVGTAIDVAEGVAPIEEPVVEAPVVERRPLRERDQPRQ
jgi:hypothetical protein